MNELLRPIAELLDDEELATLVERARLDAQTGVEGIPVSEEDDLDDDFDDEDEREEAVHAREHSLFLRGVVGLRFAARAYTLKKDPAGLRPIVWGSWALTAERFDMHLTPVEMIAGAVERVGPRLREVPGLAVRLARSPSAWVRRALARALPASEEGILRALAQDDDPEVRETAQAKVGALDEWGGAFPIAPDGHAREVLEAAREVLDAPPHELGRDAERAVAAFAPLSDALAIACWERLLSREPTSVEAVSTWIARLLERPGGGSALARITARWKERERTPTHEPWLTGAKALDETIRARASEELLARLREEASESIRKELAEAVKVLAPAQGDARALLETILGAPIDDAAGAPSDGDAVTAMHLSDVLARWPLEPVLDALIEARRAGRPGAWARVTHPVWSRLGPDPVLRERARAELASSDDVQVRRRAVSVLLGEHRGEDADDLARELYRDRELRSAVLSYAPKVVIGEARRDLERGELGLFETIAVLSRTPAEEQTDAMWAAARATRDAALAGAAKERDRALSSVGVLARAGDAWDPSDLAFVREAVELALADDEETWLLSSIVQVLERVDTPESEALLDELDARASEEAKEYIDDVRTRRG